LALIISLFAVEIVLAVAVILTLYNAFRYLSKIKRESGIGRGTYRRNSSRRFQKASTEPAKVSDYSNKKQVQVVHPQAVVTTTAPAVAEMKPNDVVSAIKEDKNSREPNDKELFKKASPDRCGHYVGYVSSLKIGMKTPDECYTCLMFVDCLKKDFKVSRCSST
jgi:hypothetical protein